MLTTIAAFLGQSVLMTSPVGGALRAAGAFLKKIPWQVWAAIALAFTLWLGWRWLEHDRKEHYQAGYKQAVADIRAAEAKKVAPLKDAKTAADVTNVTINQGVRKTHDAQNTRIDGNLADLLGMLDRAQGRVGGDAGRGVHDVAGATGSERAQASADDGLAQVTPAQGGAAGVADVLIAVPARELYARSAQCDRDYVALTSWEDAYAGWWKTYQDWLVKTRKVAKPTH